MKAEYGISKEVAPGDWRKINLILDSLEGENAFELMNRTASIVDSWFDQRYNMTCNQSEKLPEMQVYTNDHTVNTNALIIHIQNCTELSTLKSYRLVVAQYPEAQSAYDAKLKELQSQQ